jgi:hypothetical protein
LESRDESENSLLKERFEDKASNRSIRELCVR